jgi:predicted small secreted protein
MRRERPLLKRDALGDRQHGIRRAEPTTKSEIGMKLLTMLMIAAAFALTGCNTMSGLGEDIQRGGDKLENAADKRK